MAKKYRKPKRDDSGLIHYGMFVEDTNPPKPIRDAQEMLCVMKEQSEKLDAPVEDMLSEIENWLRGRINEWTRPVQDDDPPTVRRYGVRFSDGVQGVVLREDAPPQAKNCLAAVSELFLIRHHLGPGGDPHWLVRKAFLLGRLVERVVLREFEPLVLTATKRKPGERKGGKGTAKLSDDEWRLVIAERKRRSRMKGETAESASVAIAAELYAGIFPEIERHVDVKPSTIRTKTVGR